MKKAVVIALASVGALLFLSQTIVKYKFIENKCIHMNDNIEPFPCADADIPDDFTEYTIQGITLKAPDCLVPKIPEGKDDADAVRYFSEDKEMCDVQLFVNPQKVTPEYPTWKALGDDGFFKSKLTRKGVEKLGYAIPENFHDLMSLFGNMNSKDCNKLSVTEVGAFSRLAIYKEIMIPAMIGIDDKDDKLETPIEVEPHTYFYDNDKVKMYMTQSASQGGRYRLSVDCYDVNDLDSYTELVIMSAEPDLAQKIAMTVQYAEE